MREKRGWDQIKYFFFYVSGRKRKKGVERNR